MRTLYRHLLATAALGVLAWPQQASAQSFTVCPDNQDACVVEWDYNGDFVPEDNALTLTIANDALGEGNTRPAGRIYVLRRGGLYYNTERMVNSGFNLSLIGQTPEQARPEDNVCGPGGNEDCGPAVIQRIRRPDGSVDGVMLESNGDGNGGLTLRNLWIQGQDNTGVTANYEPIVLNSSNSDFLFDGVIFDRNDWHHLGFKFGGNDIFVRNSTFRNLTGNTQRYEGRSMRLEAGADTVAFENNTFMNLTSFPFQSEAVPVNYFLFNHNTLVNFGLTFSAGAIWKSAYVTNNVMVNPFYQGESADLYNAPDREDPFTGIFQIGELPARFNTLEVDRRIVLANNAYWRDPAIEAFYLEFDPAVRAQPLVNDTTQRFFDRYEGMVNVNNVNLNPGLANAPTSGEYLDQLREHIRDVSIPMTPTPWQIVNFDPGRDPSPLAINFPRPENFTYSNADLLDNGTDGLPLGDLNWYPAQRQTYLNNRAAYVQAIEDLAGGAPEPPIATLTVEGEEGIASAGATVQTVQGRTDLDLQSGSIAWTFDLGNTAPVTIGVSTLVSLNATDDARGTRLFVDGVQINTQGLYGETMFCRSDFVAYDGTTTCAQLTGGFPLEANTFGRVDFTTANVTMGAEALTLAPGIHTVELRTGWGGNFFVREFSILDAGGATLEQLAPTEAVTEGVTLVCDEGAYCPSGFQWTALGSNGSVAWTVAAVGSEVLPRIFYRSTGGATATFSINGVEAGTLMFPAGGVVTSAELTSNRYPSGGGQNTFAITAVSGDLDIDYVIFNFYGTVGNEREPLTDGFALNQSFPNPTRGSAVIRYEVGVTSEVSLDVYDVLGRKVATLADGLHASGSHEVGFNTGALATGTYLYRLTTPVGVQTRRMTVVK